MLAASASFLRVAAVAPGVDHVLVYLPVMPEYRSGVVIYSREAAPAVRWSWAG